MFLKGIWRPLLMGSLLIGVFLGSAPVFAQNAESLVQDRLAIQGVWTRVDAPYLLDFGYGEDGLLQAAYFNPQPIHVGKTETAEDDSLLYVQVVLQDVNYQGSTYTLVYDRTQDALFGTYLHGGTGNLYEVQFVRKIEDTPEK